MNRVARTRIRIKDTRLYLKTMKREAAYDGGSTGRRVRNFMPLSGGINRLALGTLQLQRDRARDLVRKVPWVESAIESLVNNVIGTGIKLLPRFPDEAFKQSASRLWSWWSPECDAEGMEDFNGLQALFFRTVIVDGEAFLRFRPRKTLDGFAVPLQLQVLEAEYCPLDLHRRLSNGNRIVSGIEFNKIGKRVAYWLYPEHPGDLLTSATSLLPRRIPAAQIIHVFETKRPGQIRGIPWLTPVVTRVRDLLEYEDAELVRKKTAAMYTAFITRNDDSDQFGEDEDFDEDENGVAETALEAGTVQILEPGEDVAFSSPADVGGSYEPFMKTQLRAVAAGIGITYEQMTGDLEKVNFSSIRAGLVEFQARAKRLQKMMIHKLCLPVWKRWLPDAVLYGGLEAPDFSSRKREYLAADWKAPGFQYVNPLQDVMATVKKIRAGLITREQAVAELGGSVEEIDLALAEENARADGLGLVLDSDPRKTTAAGHNAGQDSEEDEENPKP